MLRSKWDILDTVVFDARVVTAPQVAHVVLQRRARFAGRAGLDVRSYRRTVRAGTAGIHIVTVVARAPREEAK